MINLIQQPNADGRALGQRRPRVPSGLAGTQSRDGRREADHELQRPGAVSKQVHAQCRDQRNEPSLSSSGGRSLSEHALAVRDVSWVGKAAHRCHGNRRSDLVGCGGGSRRRSCGDARTVGTVGGRDATATGRAALVAGSGCTGTARGMHFIRPRSLNRDFIIDIRYARLRPHLSVRTKSLLDDPTIVVQDNGNPDDSSTTYTRAIRDDIARLEKA